MAKNKLELSGLTVEELVAETAKLEQHLADMRFDHSVTPLQNPSELKNVRRNIARMKTELRARELAAAAPGELKRDKLRARRRRERKN